MCVDSSNTATIHLAKVYSVFHMSTSQHWGENYILVLHVFEADRVVVLQGDAVILSGFDRGPFLGLNILCLV